MFHVQGRKCHLPHVLTELKTDLIRCDQNGCTLLLSVVKTILKFMFRGFWCKTNTLGILFLKIVSSILETKQK